jgi:hypothetical protein
VRVEAGKQPGRFRVYLNGVEQRRARMADDGSGEVERYLVDSAGNICVDRAAGIALTETVRGFVEIERIA